MDNRKVVIIGDGAVGSTTAYTLMLRDYVNEIVIIDINKDKADGDVLDMVHGMPFVTNKIIKSGTYSDLADAHIIIITAGVGQKPGETRSDLLKRNLNVFDAIIENIKKYLNDEMIILVVTNPVDVLSYYTYKKLNISSSRVIGSGTVLDSARLKYLLSKDTSIDPRNIHAFVVGEHGDSEVSAFSVSSIGGMPVSTYCDKCGKCKNKLSNLCEIHNEVVNSAYEIIAKKGSTYYAVALAVDKIVDTILNNRNSVLTVSTLVKDQFMGKIKDVYISLPVVVNSSGVVKILELTYSPLEISKIIESANKVKEAIDELKIS
ncbi:MAG: L-lactate dehydrogenase [Bacilli bacterium]